MITTTVEVRPRSRWAALRCALLGHRDILLSRTTYSHGWRNRFCCLRCSRILESSDWMEQADLLDCD